MPKSCERLIGVLTCPSLANDLSKSGYICHRLLKILHAPGEAQTRDPSTKVEHSTTSL